MTKTELQFVWDKNLIQGWGQDFKVVWVAYAFVREVAPILWKLNDFNRIRKYITSLGLKRCMDRESTGAEICFCPRNKKVKAFIDIHSRQLTNCLYSESLTKEDILENIENFKWTRVNWGKVRGGKLIRKRATIRSEVKEKGGVQYTINARRDKKHDWQTVK